MAFQFGFAADTNDSPSRSNAAAHADGASPDYSRPVKQHDLADLLDTLPERVGYSTIKIESPTGRVLYLPRRDLHDVRVQLLREGPVNDEVVDQLDRSDLLSGIYEGGFKTWECSQDLASLLLDRGPRKDIDELVRCDQIVELGAGTALPTLVLFQHALLNAIPLNFVLQDYNDTVLRLVTLPNIILTWAANTENEDFPAIRLSDSSQDDFELPKTLLQRFTSEMESKNITFTFLSGPWSHSLESSIPHAAPDFGMVVLAAETIYSPASTASFVELLVSLLKRVKMAKAMIGAKRIYFGVGGSVDGLKEACREKGAVAYEIENHGVPGMDSGVGRALIEVQMY